MSDTMGMHPYASRGIIDFVPHKSFNNCFDLEDNISDALNDIDDMIKEAKYFSAILNSGIKLSEYKRFKETIPQEIYIDYRPSVPFPQNKAQATEEDAWWIYNFVTNSIINWQSLGLEPAVSSRFIQTVDEFIKKKTILKNPD